MAKPALGSGDLFAGQLLVLGWTATDGDPRQVEVRVTNVEGRRVVGEMTARLPTGVVQPVGTFVGYLAGGALLMRLSRTRAVWFRRQGRTSALQGGRLMLWGEERDGSGRPALEG